MELLKKIYIFIPLIIVLFLLTGLMVNYKSIRLLIIIIGSFVLTWLTLFQFTSPAWQWSQSAELLSKNDNPDDTAYAFVRNNFILIDNSLDKDLLPDEEHDPGDSLAFVITNRRKLGTFLQALYEKADVIDLVVCDIGFDRSTTFDTLVRDGFLPFAQAGKLILSTPAGLHKNPVISFPDSIYGNIREQTNELGFISHQIQQKGHISLPYKVYQHLHHSSINGAYLHDKVLREKKSGQANSWILNPFFPTFQITNEKILLQGGFIAQDSITENMEEYPYFYYLGETSNVGLRQSFLQNLKKRHQKGMRNIVLIGSYTSDKEDTYATLFGPLHGPVILLNIIYALEKRSHQVGIGLILLLISGYALIFYVLINRSLNIPLLLFRSQHRPSQSRKISLAGRQFSELLRFFFEILKALFHFIFVEELHFVLLLLLVGIVKWTTGIFINALAAALVLGLVYISLKYAREVLFNRT
jgi:uncharacterized membrane protein (Fun14 family)